MLGFCTVATKSVLYRTADSGERILFRMGVGHLSHVPFPLEAPPWRKTFFLRGLSCHFRVFLLAGFRRQIPGHFPATSRPFPGHGTSRPLPGHFPAISNCILLCFSVILATSRPLPGHFPGHLETCKGGHPWLRSQDRWRDLAGYPYILREGPRMNLGSALAAPSYGFGVLKSPLSRTTTRETLSVMCSILGTHIFPSYHYEVGPSFISL